MCAGPGPRGFVPLEDMEFFCSWKCIEQHCCDEQGDEVDTQSE